MKRDACSMKRNRLIVLHVDAGTTAGLLPSGRRFNRNCATSATPTVSDTTAGMAVMTTTAATTTIVATIAIATTTIGGDEFHSLSNRPRLTSASDLLVYPAKGLGNNAGAFICSSCESCNPV